MCLTLPFSRIPLYCMLLNQPATTLAATTLALSALHLHEMAMKMQTLILITLLDRLENIFADGSQVEFWHLTERLFEKPNPVLSDSE